MALLDVWPERWRCQVLRGETAQRWADLTLVSGAHCLSSGLSGRLWVSESGLEAHLGQRCKLGATVYLSVLGRSEGWWKRPAFLHYRMSSV